MWKNRSYLGISHNSKIVFGIFRINTKLLITTTTTENRKKKSKQQKTNEEKWFSRCRNCRWSLTCRPFFLLPFSSIRVWVWGSIDVLSFNFTRRPDRWCRISMIFIGGKEVAWENYCIGSKELRFLRKNEIWSALKTKLKKGCKLEQKSMHKEDTLPKVVRKQKPHTVRKKNE